MLTKDSLIGELSVLARGNGIRIITTEKVDSSLRSLGKVTSSDEVWAANIEQISNLENVCQQNVAKNLIEQTQKLGGIAIRIISIKKEGCMVSSMQAEAEVYTI
jgi:hypothetical protein